MQFNNIQEEHNQVMDIIEVQDPDDVASIVPVIKSAWGLTDMGQIVKDIAVAMNFHGGLVLLARDGDKVVGMLFGFPGRFGSRSYLYSHMTGVVNEKKYSGIGQKLKLRQREWALSRGYDLVCWTFDPLMSLNGNLNIGKLGGIARSFIPNFYGNMEDSLNRGNYTDRVVCEWWIKAGERTHNTASETYNPLSLVENLSSIMERKNPFLLQIPEDYLGIKKENPERAKSLRMGYRDVFRKIFNGGYVLAGFDRRNSAYIVVEGDQLSGKIGEPVFPVR